MFRPSWIALHRQQSTNSLMLPCSASANSLPLDRESHAIKGLVAGRTAQGKFPCWQGNPRRFVLETGATEER
jgi:hypothetical protein